MSFSRTPRFPKENKKVRTQGPRGTEKKIILISPRNEGVHPGAAGPGAAAQTRRNFRRNNPLAAGPPPMKRGRMSRIGIGAVSPSDSPLGRQTLFTSPEGQTGSVQVSPSGLTGESPIGRQSLFRTPQQSAKFVSTPGNNSGSSSSSSGRLNRSNMQSSLTQLSPSDLRLVSTPANIESEESPLGRLFVSPSSNANKKGGKRKKTKSRHRGKSTKKRKIKRKTKKKSKRRKRKTRRKMGYRGKSSRRK